MSPGRDALPARLALAGAALGGLAGFLELTIGPSMRSWVGGKQDTTRLGLATRVLAAVALAAAVALQRGRRRAAGSRVVLALGLLVLCGALYVFLGATAAGPAGGVGVLGGVLIMSVARPGPATAPDPHLVLLLGALPFALLTWWSLVTPLLAFSAIVTGHVVIRGARAPRRRIATTTAGPVA